MYKNVNSTDTSNIDKELRNCNFTRLSYNEASKLEGLLSYDEVSLTLKNMKNDKSPGCDGFTVHFLKHFGIN